MSNTSNTFMGAMMHVLRSFRGKFVVVYFDDILIYCKTMNEHLDHNCKIFLTLHADKFRANFRNCSLMQNQVLLLYFIMSTQEISADPDKVKSIREWSEPKTLAEARSFYSLISFYRSFIKQFSTITIPIIACLKLETFKWIMLYIKPT